MSEPQPFVYTTKAAALTRHTMIARELGELARELALVLHAEREAEVAAWRTNPGSDKTHDRAGKTNSLPNVREVWRIKGEMRALEEERDDIRTNLAYGGIT